uniref:Uncharacterized protein n=1 Tax=Lepeophtheirus salmonis TaxID=72036 RepID=A0A0K2TY17_LEPSM
MYDSWLNLSPSSKYSSV